MQAAVVQQVLALAQQVVAAPHRDRLDAYIRSYARAIPAEVLSEAEPRVMLGFLTERYALDRKSVV